MGSDIQNPLETNLPNGHYIAGTWDNGDGEEVFEFFEPCTGTVLGTLPVGTETDVGRAIDSAHDGFEEWRKLSPKVREEGLRALADQMESESDRLSELEIANTGKPSSAAREEVLAAIDTIRFFAGYPTKVFGQSIPINETDTLCYTIREPIGVIGAITPWNYPLVIASGKVGAAMAAGCSVVVKPAPETPLTTLELANLATKVGIPNGVLNVVAGTDKTGSALTKNSGIAKFTFTGSSYTGKQVLLELAPILRPATMELGGKSPNIVFDDINLEETVSSVLMAGLYNSGQECCAGARVLVHEGIFNQFLELVPDRISKISVGPSNDLNSKIGPLISANQVERVKGFVERALDEGAQILTKGTVPEGGFYFEPTILVNVNPTMEACREEIFGPVLTIDSFSDDDEALSKANSSLYGLAAGIWTKDISRAIRFANELEAGQVWINSYLAGDCSAPFGGGKDSGFGRELGYEGLKEFTQTKTVFLQGAP